MCFPQRQHFLSCYWTVSSPALQHHDPSLPYLEQYQLGRAQFTSLFLLLQPWGPGAYTPTLARWTFRLLDDNHDGLVNFREFCRALGKVGAKRPVSFILFFVASVLILIGKEGQIRL